MTHTEDLVKLLEDAEGREWITGRDPADHETTICIRIIESDRRWILKALAALSTRPAQGDKADALQDSAYIAGMQEGFRLGLDENHEGLASRITARDGYLAPLTRPAPAAEVTGEIEAIINADTKAWGEHLRITSYCHDKCLMPKLRAALAAAPSPHASGVGEEEITRTIMSWLDRILRDRSGARCVYDGDVPALARAIRSLTTKDVQK